MELVGAEAWVTDIAPNGEVGGAAGSEQGKDFGTDCFLLLGEEDIEDVEANDGVKLPGGVGGGVEMVITRDVDAASAQLTDIGAEAAAKVQHPATQQVALQKYPCGKGHFLPLLGGEVAVGIVFQGCHES